MSDGAWVDGAALDAGALSQAAAWLSSMDDDYYRLFAVPRVRLEALLAGLLRDPDSEFGTSVFRLHDGGLAGFVSAFPSEQVFARRTQVLKALLDAAPNPTEARQRVRGFDGAARKLPPDTFYLAKLYLSAPLRGSGLADCLLDRVMATGRRLGRHPCLHVRRDNAIARAFYRRHGFVDATDPTLSSTAYVLMEAKRSDPTRRWEASDGTA